MYKRFEEKLLSLLSVPVLIVIGIVILMGILTHFYFQKFNNSINDYTKLYMTELSNRSAYRINSQIKGGMQHLTLLSDLITQENGIDAKTIFPIMNDKLSDFSFKRIGIVELNGIAKTSDNLMLDLKDRDYINKSIKGEPAISDTLVDKADNKKINVISVPIYNSKQKITSVLFATMDNDRFKNVMSVPILGKNGCTSIIKEDGSVITNTHTFGKGIVISNIFNDNRFISQKDVDSIKKDFQNRKSNMVSYNHKGKHFYISYSPLDYNGWYIYSLTPENIVTKTFFNFLTVTAFAGVLVIILFLILFLYIIFLQNRHGKTLEQIVYVDDVTGEHTWNYFKLHAESILSETDKNYAFVLFDIDKFKILNDIFGVDMGNKTLKYVAQVLKSSLKEDEISARITNDNFAILIHADTKEILRKRFKKFIKILSNYKITEDTPYSLSISMGIYHIEDKTTDFDLMYSRALSAKKLIKDNAGSNFNYYDNEMRNKILHANGLEQDMHRALQDNEFVIYLQPKYSLIDSSIVGAEALVRWIHPHKGLIPPNDFIPLFEKNGFIARLDLYIFETVCKKIRNWIDEDRTPVVVSVNISRVNFHNTNLAKTLYNIASRYKIPMGFIEVEITESAVFENIENLINIIKDLRKFGFPVSIDDFGTGYSSLNLLKDLEVDVLKLDREFFNFTTDVERGQKVVANMILMAKNLNIRTVSEGVETIEHVQFLQEIGCDIAQGYYFARPMPIEEFEKLALEKV